jgi:hypothetical protein
MAPNGTKPDSPPPAWDFDQQNPGIPIVLYLNDGRNDCVIEARAHHTIRLIYQPGQPPLSISADDVSAEYELESLANIGIDIQESLPRWQSPGWTAGGVSGRTIASWKGPLSVDGAGAASGDATNDIGTTELMNLIIQHTCVQGDFKLPLEISPNDPASFGQDSAGNNIVWADTTGIPVTRHVMLLTGYDQQGPIGITWGKKQQMTWQFFQKFCMFGVYWVQKGPNT